jgi:hypothetical protein
MGRYEFKFVISDVELTDEQQETIGQAVGQAGATAVSHFTDAVPLYIPLGLRHVWCGIPPAEVVDEIESYAKRQAGEAPERD